ncbi:MAG TPA: thrombospondin type 3 repeat-containing protein, partial [Candidatus Hydrogenedentes bacterium]|nr:thrombospondin type 3 repeat-containing protein [Candidatus Hydrogenedentota bacterium]
TDPANADSDGDGIADGYEVEYGLNPLDPADADADSDGDGLTNLEEFWLRADPHASASPYSTVHVSEDGSDESGDGSPARPWRTIQFAMDQVSPMENLPATVLAGPGKYTGAIVLKPFVRLQGYVGETDAAVVEGTVEGAEGALLQRLVLREGDDKDGDIALLSMNDAAMNVLNVAFHGADDSSRATGIVFRGEAPGGALISDCTFTELRRGMEIFGSLPTVRRCAFSKIVEHGIIIRALPEKAGTQGSLGNVYNPNTGWNTFQDIGGYDVVNERSQTVVMQNNGWGAADPATRISGPVNYDPPLASGSSLVPASIVCTVWDAKDKFPIVGGSILLT